MGLKPAARFFNGATNGCHFSVSFNYVTLFALRRLD